MTAPSCDSWTDGLATECGRPAVRAFLLLTAEGKPAAILSYRCEICPMPRRKNWKKARELTLEEAAALALADEVMSS